MKLLKAILLGIFLWILIFIWWSIIMEVPALSGRLLLQWLIHFALLVPACVLVARVYYMSDDKMSGFFLGIIFIVVAIVLDLLVTIHIVPGGFGRFFSNPFLWIGFIELLFVVWITEVVSV